MMTKVLLYDHSFPVPQDIKHLLGVNCFSDIYYRKKSVDRWVSDMCSAAGIQFVNIGGDRTAQEAVKQIGMLTGRNLLIMYLPAFIAFGCPEEDALLFLKKLSLTRSSLLVSAKAASFSIDKLQIAVAVGDLAHSLIKIVGAGGDVNELLKNSATQMHVVEGDVKMIDMRNPLQFTDYLTSNFDVRFFNAVQSINDFVVVKYSSEVEKLRREYTYYGLLPPFLQMFFIQPYEFLLENGRASYKMERVFVPDMALQWIHGSLDEPSFERFLDKTFHYISIRPKKRVSTETARSVHADAYRNKVFARLQQLKAKAEYERIKHYLQASFGGIDALFGRYSHLLDRVGDKVVDQELCIGHGDLCFSNILYSKTTGLMRFIDPRGADCEDDLFVSPYYDLAKLSHSIVGNYDFINYGLYRLEIDNDLEMSLSIDHGAPSWARAMFEAKLRESGYNPLFIRLLEASLFLSMVPLHIDYPKKVIAFLINANTILNEIDNNL